MASKTVFVFALVSALLAWIDLAVIPAVYVFRSENRTLFAQLVWALPYFTLGGIALARYPARSERMYLPCVATSRRDCRSVFHVCGFVCFILACFFCIYLAWLADQANRGGLFVASPCGASSCSSVLDTSSVVFNAIGFFGSALTGTQIYSDFVPTTCLFDGCNWADGNGRNVSGFFPQPNVTGCADYAQPDCTAPTCLAGNRTQDYPNPAIGIGGGMRSCLGVSTLSKTTTCPGTLVTVVGATTVLKGKATCSFCLPWFRKHAGYVDPATAYCPSLVPNNPGAEDNSLWCGALCPQLDEIRTPIAMLQQAVYANALAVWFLIPWLFIESMVYVQETCIALKKEEFEKAAGKKKDTTTTTTPRPKVEMPKEEEEEMIPIAEEV